LDSGDPDRALVMFHKALALDLKLPESLAGIGKALVRKGQPAQAFAYLTKATALEPDSANFHYQPETIYVAYCDAAVQCAQLFGPSDPVRLEASGGGGTDFCSAFQ
jgi:tetratricopeptide (TPR) repeat protein